MWQYRQVVYTPGNRTWQANFGDRGPVLSEQFWISEICDAPEQREWELLAVVPEGNLFHFVFRKPLQTR